MRPLALLYPPRCMLCGAWIAEEQGGLCPACREQAERDMRQMFCRPPAQVEALICAAPYAGRMRRALTQLKFEQRRAWLAPLAGLMAQVWALHGMPRPDVLTCVPLSAPRTHGRGFNQSEELAKLLAARWDVPFVRALRRRALSPRQSALRAAERWDNAQRAFAARADIDLGGKCVLLVDDIVTTGATASTCAGLLRRLGARRVWVLAAAKTGG